MLHNSIYWKCHWIILILRPCSICNLFFLFLQVIFLRPWKFWLQWHYTQVRAAIYTLTLQNNYDENIPRYLNYYSWRFTEISLSLLSEIYWLINFWKITSWFKLKHYSSLQVWANDQYWDGSRWEYFIEKILCTGMAK